MHFLHWDTSMKCNKIKEEKGLSALNNFGIRYHSTHPFQPAKDFFVTCINSEI